MSEASPTDQFSRVSVVSDQFAREPFDGGKDGDVHALLSRLTSSHDGRCKSMLYYCSLHIVKRELEY